VGDKRMALELICKDLLEQPCALIFLQLVKAEGGPSLGAHFDHPGRVSALVLVGMCANESVFGLLEEERKGIQRAGGTKPGKLVRLQIERWLEVFFEGFADVTVDAIRADDRVALGEARKIGNRGPEMEPDIKLAASPLQDVE